MPVSLIPAFLFYCYTNGITPGPANLCSLSAAMNYGRKQALIQWRGLIFGFWIDAMIAVLINGVLGAALGKYVGYLSYVGAAYILWLAWKTLTRKPAGADSAEVTRPLGFRDGFLLQFLNVKVIMLGLAAYPGYFLPHGSGFPLVLLFAVTMTACCGTGNLIWTAAGSLLFRVYSRCYKAVNAVMAALLVYCAVKVLMI